MIVLEYCKFSEDFYTRDNKNQWGLALTQNLIGRLYQYQEEEDSLNSQKQFKMALASFKQIDHYRGIYMSSKDLYDLRQ